ncbi:uncharacterized protein LOC126840229 [Adelges cooleyi]|uniref:uncharacterized protein LOC126840229 n=1 Tax=Adelges cooleyi TaxID=133065 RepID=UPI0021802978|nr:uncharacterized protein LOC126840229 [Adelges cooleyi]
MYMVGLNRVLNPDKTNNLVVGGCNIYKIIYSIVPISYAVLAIFSAIGVYYWASDFNTWINCVFLFVISFILLLKVIRINHTADTIWKCFDILCDDFLTYCGRQRSGVLDGYKKKISRVTNLYTIGWVCFVVCWYSNPVFIKQYIAENPKGQLLVYRNNVLNTLFYPIQVDHYNRFYALFFIAEALIAAWYLVITFAFYSFTIDFCWTFVADLRTIASAYESLGNEDDCTETLIKKFKAITYDHQKVMNVIKQLYDSLKPIIIIEIGSTAYTFIYMTIEYISFYMEGLSLYSIASLKILSTMVRCIIHLYILTYHFGLVDHEINALNFSLYSCDWTSKDIKFKKLLLMAMQINNANDIKMKVSPKKVVNLEMLGSVLQTSYSVISIIAKNKKQ